MDRIVTFILLALGILCASAQTPTPTVTVTASPSSVASVSPSPSPTPFFPESDYNVTTNGKPGGTICIRMVGNLTVTVQYPRTGKSKTNSTDDILMLDVSQKAAVDRENSNCTAKTRDTNGTMILHWNTTHNSPYSLLFFFDADSSNWKLNKIEFRFTVNGNKDFENYTMQSNFTELSAVDNKTVFTNEFERSYRCDSLTPNDLKVQTPDTKLKVTFTTTDWQVQAFDFPTQGNFTNDRRCTADISSSKIVPIAVGAALAGLVVVVLVAYLIGRFKNRKQNSYEALS